MVTPFPRKGARVTLSCYDLLCIAGRQVSYLLIIICTSNGSFVLVLQTL
uniref:Uncharacterized protein n=1 Tax=Anguilla anguilla TaxID=7936 RepID=A0A0E9T545_ANGAN